MKTTNIKEVKVKSAFFHGGDFKIPGFDRITMPERSILKVLVTYDDEKKPVEVYNVDSDKNANELIEELNHFMEENGLKTFLNEREITAFTYLEANKYIERKSHDEMWCENRELKEKIAESEEKIAELKEKIAGWKRRVAVYSKKYGSDGPLGLPFQLKPKGKPGITELFDPDEETPE